MAVLPTVDDFLACVRKSGVLDPKRLDDYLEKLRAAPDPPATAPRLADAMVRDGLLTGFQAEQLRRGRWRNFTISGKYVLLERLGAGGMGQVFLCEHRVMRRCVALKVLPPAQARDP